MRFITTSIMFIIIAATGSRIIAAQQSGSIKGVIVDRHTKEALAGASVRVSGTVFGAGTDASGRFTISSVPPGLYSLEVRLLGYQSFVRTDVEVAPGRSTGTTIELQETPIESEGVTVSSGYFQQSDATPVSAVAFNAQEIRRSPGSANDVSRILMALPSVSAVADNANDLAVRGGSPMENGFMVDDIPVPNINHFPVQGSTGGPIGILNVDFIDNVEFLTSGFSAAYGDRMSSVVDVRLRSGNSDKLNGKVFLNFAGFGAQSDGPLPFGTWMISASKSYLDLLVGAIGTGAAPQYGDVQGKAVLDLSSTQRLTIIDIFGQSQIDFTQKSAKDLGQRYFGLNRNLQNTIGASWRGMWNASYTSMTTLSYSFTRYRGDFSKVATGVSALRTDNTEGSLVLRSLHTIMLDRRSWIEAGAEARYEDGTFDYTSLGDVNRLGVVDPSYDISKTMPSPKGGVFITANLMPVERLTVSAGVRGAYYDRNAAWYAEPRIALSYDASEVLTLKANAGIVHQELPLILLSSGEFTHVPQPKVLHAGIGAEYHLSADTRLTVEGYVKEYSELPIDPADPTLSVVDQAVFNQRFSMHPKLESTGRAQTRGAEIMLQKKMAQDFYGLVSASISHCTYRDGLGVWRSRIYDNRFIFSVIGGYKPEGTWEYGIRWSYAGGVPYTPFDLAASAGAGSGIIDQSNIMAERYPAYHSMNVRVDKKFYSERHMLDVYLSIWNAYNRKNVAGYFWNATTNTPDTQYQWSMLPVVGIEYEF
ncbi:MAG TPA: TonB-dependent receptor [Bacteroidota bacterium]|nr:TonB-dependent receptor [Bacteroidota bacterium]